MHFYYTLLSPGQTALDGLITAKKRQKVVSRKQPMLFALKTSYSLQRDKTWRKIGTALDAEESFELLKTLAHNKNGLHTWWGRATHMKHT